MSTTTTIQPHKIFVRVNEITFPTNAKPGLELVIEPNGVHMI